MHKKFLIVIITAIVCSVMIASWYFTPKQINKTMHGFSYQLGNEESGENIDIKINGELRKTFTGKKIFKGIIDIEGIDYPMTPQEREVEMNFVENQDFMVYKYIDKEDSDYKPEMFNLGAIHINNTFSQLTIRKIDKDGSWNGNNGLMITAPATDRNEALKISNELLEDYRLEGSTFDFAPKE